jgi:two-component SAPR family response regulator
MKMLDETIPVVLSSAYHEYKQDLGAWASDEYVVKSADSSDLKKAISKLIGQG